MEVFIKGDENSRNACFKGPEYFLLKMKVSMKGKC